MIVGLAVAAIVYVTELPVWIEYVSFAIIWLGISTIAVGLYRIVTFRQAPDLTPEEAMGSMEERFAILQKRFRDREISVDEYRDEISMLIYYPPDGSGPLVAHIKSTVEQDIKQDRRVTWRKL